MGDCLIGKREFQEAIAAYDGAIAVDPSDGMAWIHRGLALFNLGEIRAALESVDKGMAFWPGHPTARMLKAQLELRLAVEGK